jgi:hypothetical protein
MKKKTFLISMLGVCLGFILFMLIKTDFNISFSNTYFIPILAFSFLSIAFFSFIMFLEKISESDRNRK